MSGSRARTSNSVSLFPFLAVLVCAMGALIFLLIVTTRRIRSEALAKAAAVREEQETSHMPRSTILADPNLAISFGPQRSGFPFPQIQEPPLPEEPERIESIPGLVTLGPAQSRPVLPRKIEPPPEPKPAWPAAIAEKPAPPDPNIPLRAEFEKLQAAREAWQEHVRNKEQKALELKQKVEELTKGLQKINSQIEAVAKQRLEDRQTERELEQARDRIRGQIAKIEQEIETSKTAVRGAPTKFQVVPFDGQTGTNYRPIIIECTAQGMRFQPEGVTLTETDFDGFTLGKNPLLAGSQALSDYWMRVSVRSDGKEPAPYVLLIVRPSGAKYFAAKQLLEALDRPFGYELVEENLPIDIPPLDPAAAELCKSAVENVLKEREDLKRLLAAHGPEMLSRNPRYRVIKKPGGGFDVEYASPNGPPRIEGLGPEPGVSAADNLPRTDRYGQPYRSLTGKGEGEDGGRFPAPFPPGETDPRAPRPVERGLGEGRIDRNPYVDSPGTQSVVGPDREPDPTGSGEGGRVPDPNEPRRLPEDLIQRSQGNLPYITNDAEPGRLGNIARAPAPTDQIDPERGQGGAQEPAADSNPNQATDSQSGTGDNLVPPAPAATGEPAENANPNQTNAAQPPSNQPKPIDDPQIGTAQPSPGAPSAKGNPMTGSAGSAPAPGSSHEPPMPNFLSMNARRSLNPATPYQRRWGISDPRASIGFEREVTVRVEANRLIVGNAFQVSYTAKSTQNELAAGMLEALELTVRKWGRPPMSFYWVPTVRFEVGAAEVEVYQLLDNTAKAWGLETSAEAIQN